MPSAVARLSAAMLALLSGAALWAMFCRAANVVQVVAAKPGQIESSIDLPYQVIFGNGVAKMKLVEQLTLVTLQTAHH